MPKGDSKKSSQRSDSEIQRLIQLYESGLTMKEVGAEFGITAQRVEQILKKAGVKKRKYTRSNRLLEARKKKRKILPEELLLKLYKDEKLPIPEILRRLDTSRSLLYKSLASFNIPKRVTGVIQSSELTEKLLRRLYLEEDLTAAEIARRLGYASITIKKRLSKFGIRKQDRQT
jgi:predicted DNA-binding protein YlxM (UPF0122 family)